MQFISPNRKPLFPGGVFPRKTKEFPDPWVALESAQSTKFMHEKTLLRWFIV